MGRWTGGGGIGGVNGWGASVDYNINPTCITVCIENTRYSSYVLFCNTTAN